MLMGFLKTATLNLKCNVTRKNDNKKNQYCGYWKIIGWGMGGGGDGGVKYFYLLNIKPKHHHT